MFKVAIATALYCLLHTALANDWTKVQARSIFGSRVMDALYRPIFVVQATILLALLVAYIRRQQGRELYAAGGAWAWLLRAGQAASLAILIWSGVCVGLNHLTGWDGLAAWRHDAADVPRMPDGQEPSVGENGTMRIEGPLAYSRHPLNWCLLPLFWLNPRMTTRLLAFNLILTAYVFLGSFHAEQHMLSYYGESYQAYMERVPFFLPRP